ncbi:MAG: hypothetical protein ACXVH3_28505 [Solirubrobacteraceae bacterium]
MPSAVAEAQRTVALSFVGVHSRPGLERRALEPMPDEQTGFDIGPETADRYAAEIGAAATCSGADRWAGSSSRYSPEALEPSRKL